MIYLLRKALVLRRRRNGQFFGRCLRQGATLSSRSDGNAHEAAGLFVCRGASVDCIERLDVFSFMGNANYFPFQKLTASPFEIFLPCTLLATADNTGTLRHPDVIPANQIDPGHSCAIALISWPRKRLLLASSGTRSCPQCGTGILSTWLP